MPSDVIVFIFGAPKSSRISCWVVIPLSTLDVTMPYERDCDLVFAGFLSSTFSSMLSHQLCVVIQCRYKRLHNKNNNRVTVLKIIPLNAPLPFIPFMIHSFPCFYRTDKMMTGLVNCEVKPGSLPRHCYVKTIIFLTNASK